MKTKSKSKTFDVQTDMGNVVDWLVSNIETEDREIPYGGCEPSLDIKVETIHKYVVTITQLIPDEDGKA